MILYLCFGNILRTRKDCNSKYRVLKENGLNQQKYMKLHQNYSNKNRSPYNIQVIRCINLSIVCMNKHQQKTPFEDRKKQKMTIAKGRKLLKNQLEPRSKTLLLPSTEELLVLHYPPGGVPTGVAE